MKLDLDLKSLFWLLMLAGEGLRKRENVLGRLRASALSPRKAQAVLDALNAGHELEKSMAAFSRSRKAGELHEALAALDAACAKLEKAGWGTLEIRAEAMRYEPHCVWTSGAYRLKYYNPHTGKYDASVDQGWGACGLPPKRKAASAGR